MGERTGIEWCDGTFNPWWGCVEVGPGCENCYARSWAERHGFFVWGHDVEYRYFGDNHWHEPVKWNKKALSTFGRRMRVFTASFGDVFDKRADPLVRARLFALIKACPDIDWIIVTKRIGNAAEMLPPDWGDGYFNVILLITVCDQAEAMRDVPKLLATPATCRGLSVEPMLGSVTIMPEWWRGLDWIICGGESRERAPRLARAPNPQWVRDLSAQCEIVNFNTDHFTAFFFKQWGEWQGQPISAKWSDFDHIHDDHKIHWSSGDTSIFTRKKLAGALLDGREWKEFPR